MDFGSASHASREGWRRVQVQRFARVLVRLCFCFGVFGEGDGDGVEGEAEVEVEVLG